MGHRIASYTRLQTETYSLTLQYFAFASQKKNLSTVAEYTDVKVQDKLKDYG